MSWAVQRDWWEKHPCSGVKLPHGGECIERTVLKPTQISDTTYGVLSHNAIYQQLALPVATSEIFYLSYFRQDWHHLDDQNC